MNLEKEIRDTIKRLPRNIDEIEKKPIYEILILMGGGLSMIFAPIFFIFDVVTFGGRSPLINVLHAIVILLICMVFGFGLLYTYANLRKRPKTTLIFGFFCSILLFAGGYAGWAGGLLGLIGLLLYFAKKSDIL